jgi:hypothetical protein
VRDEISAIVHREIPAELVKDAWPRLAFDNRISREPFEKFLKQAREVGFLRAEVNLDKLIWTP